MGDRAARIGPSLLELMDRTTLEALDDWAQYRTSAPGRAAMLIVPGGRR